jgi:hypothetical protein
MTGDIPAVAIPAQSQGTAGVAVDDAGRTGAEGPAPCGVTYVVWHSRTSVDDPTRSMKLT